MNEKQLEARFVSAVAAMGGECLKMYPASCAGIPDRIALLAGDAFFVEFKTKGEKPRKLQVWWRLRLNSVGFKVFTVDSFQTLLDAELYAAQLSNRSAKKAN